MDRPQYQVMTGIDKPGYRYMSYPIPRQPLQLLYPGRYMDTNYYYTGENIPNSNPLGLEQTKEVNDTLSAVANMEKQALSKHLGGIHNIVRHPPVEPEAILEDPNLTGLTVEDRRGLNPNLRREYSPYDNLRKVYSESSQVIDDVRGNMEGRGPMTYYDQDNILPEYDWEKIPEREYGLKVGKNIPENSRYYHTGGGYQQGRSYVPIKPSFKPPPPYKNPSSIQKKVPMREGYRRMSLGGYTRRNVDMLNGRERTYGRNEGGYTLGVQCDNTNQTCNLQVCDDAGNCDSSSERDCDYFKWCGKLKPTWESQMCISNPGGGDDACFKKTCNAELQTCTIGECVNGKCDGVTPPSCDYFSDCATQNDVIKAYTDSDSGVIYKCNSDSGECTQLNCSSTLTGCKNSGDSCPSGACKNPSTTILRECTGDECISTECNYDSETCRQRIITLNNDGKISKIGRWEDCSEGTYESVCEGQDSDDDNDVFGIDWKWIAGGIAIIIILILVMIGLYFLFRKPKKNVRSPEYYPHRSQHYLPPQNQPISYRECVKKCSELYPTQPSPKFSSSSVNLPKDQPIIVNVGKQY